jgi:hypothetical protein
MRSEGGEETTRARRALVVSCLVVLAAVWTEPVRAAPQRQRSVHPPTCRVVPDSGPVGTKLDLFGSHWKPHSAVSISMSGNQHQTGPGWRIASAKVHADGKISAAGKVPDRFLPGGHTIRFDGHNTSGVPVRCADHFKVTK